MQEFQTLSLLASLAWVTFAPTTVHAQEWRHFRGMCDASALEMLDNDLFVVGNDEDNILRVYSRRAQNQPVQELDFSSFYGLRKPKKEIDLEGSARIGDLIYWISSHGANAKGRYQPSRHRLFATQVITNQGVLQLRTAGRLYTNLIRDLINTPALAGFNLRSAALKAPKARNALNIEGLAPTPEGHLLIGFRNPIPNGRALLVPLLNPSGVVSGHKGEFGTPVLLDLNGLGIRSITPYRNGYLIVAGSFDGSGASHLFHWKGETVRHLLDRPLPGNPEGIAITGLPEKPILFALNDDGTMKIANTDCKKLKNSAARTFRGYDLPLPEERHASWLAP